LYKLGLFCVAYSDRHHCRLGFERSSGGGNFILRFSVSNYERYSWHFFTSSVCRVEHVVSRVTESFARSSSGAGVVYSGNSGENFGFSVESIEPEDGRYLRIISEYCNMSESLAYSEITDYISDKGSDEVEIILAYGRRRVDDECKIDGDIVLAGSIAVEDTEFESINKFVDKFDQAVFEN